MGAIGLQVIRAMIVHCHSLQVCTSGGQEWLIRCNNLSSPFMHCLQHEGNLPKVPLQPIVATAPLDLLHIDFTSIEMTMELNQPCLESPTSWCSRTISQSMSLVYVTPHQTAKTVVKFLYQGYISIFGAPARLLSNRGTNFMSSIIDEMCTLLGMKKLWTMPYHPQTNGLVERSHQTIMWMIGKLVEDKKADWPGHLAEIVQACNATWLCCDWGIVHNI